MNNVIILSLLCRNTFISINKGENYQSKPLPMKKQLELLLLLIAFLPAGAYSQCTPDTVNCKDVMEPGQICPQVLADGYLGISYNQTVTILPPASATINDITINLVKIEIDTVTNMPPGLTYEASATEMYPGTAYCVLVTGVPTQIGEFMLDIVVIPYINLLDDIVALPPVENDTSVKITIYESLGINDLTDNAFQVIENRPNPFSETTEIGYVLNEPAEVKLTIHSNIGILVYSETMQAKSGLNLFRFNGENIGPGHYIYSIVNKQSVFTGKMIKTGGR
jgi:hypothetical protein